MKCKVCGYEFDVNHLIDNHYIAQDDDAQQKQYDAFDCPHCGCQMIVQERKQKYIANRITKPKPLDPCDVPYGDNSFPYDWWNSPYKITCNNDVKSGNSFFTGKEESE